MMDCAAVIFVRGKWNGLGSGLLFEYVFLCLLFLFELISKFEMELFGNYRHADA
jgi:hypothetical protein